LIFFKESLPHSAKGIPMEVTVKTTELSDVFRLVRPVTEKKTTIPILGTVLLTAERNRLLVTGTDLETGAICPCPATVRKPGKIAIPAQRLHEYVKVLPEGELDLKAQVKLRTGSL
jgi:DNA polymerase III subunit beta